MTIKGIANAIKKSKKMAIIGHISPDLDCLGSAFSLKEVLSKNFNIKVSVFADGKIKENEKEIFYPNNLETKEFKAKDYDLIITVDTPNISRLGKYADEVKKHKNIIKIDHHYDNLTPFTENFYVDEKSASCCEIVYLVIKELTKELDKNVATFLYAGITGDTNSFLNSNSTPNSMMLAGFLFEKGADVNNINQQYFKSKTKNQWELMKYIYQKVTFLDNFAYVGLKLKDLKRFNVSGDGLSSFANELICIKGIDVSCVFVEKNLKTYYCSFRSKEGYSVRDVAQKLGGGGHVCAAACLLNGSYGEVKNKIVKIAKEEILKGQKNG